MANIDIALKRIFAWAVLLVVVISGVVVYAHYAAQYRQANRELIYMKARQQVAVEKRQRLLEYQKRLREQELRRQYNRGRVVNVSVPPAE